MQQTTLPIPTQDLVRDTHSCLCILHQLELGASIYLVRYARQHDPKSLRRGFLGLLNRSIL
jgi:hypothetical protein